MNSDWTVKSLGEITNSLNSKRVPVSGLKRKKMQGQYRYFGASGVVDYVNDFIFDGKYLLISEDGENLRTRKTPIAFIAEGKYWVNNHAHIIDEKEEGTLDFLECYFRYLDISPYITGAVQPKLNKASLDRIEVNFPKKEIRLKINKIYNEIKLKIDLNNQINSRLEGLAQTIFKSWFVDFDPVHAKKLALEKGLSPAQTERAAMAIISGVCCPNDFAENFKEMDKKLSEKLSKMSKKKQEELAHTASLFPSEFEDSELGEIPKEWKSSIISDEYSLTMGQSPKGDTYNENGNGTLFFQGRTDFGFRYPKPRVYTTDPKRIAQKGDTLISVRAPVGDKNLANEDCCIGRGLAALRHKTGLVSYTYYHISYIEGSLDDLGGSGTVFNAINKDTLSNIKIIAPTERLIRAFDKTISSFDLLIGNNTTELDALEKLRDTLLPKLLSGEIDLSKIQIED